MAIKRITIQLKGSAADNEHLRLSDFIAQLEAIKGALTKLESSLTGKSSIYYRVVDLRHSSPATVVLDAVPMDSSVRGDVTNLVVDSFVAGINKIRQGIAPKGFGYDLMESMKKIAQPMKRRVTEVSISTDTDSAQVTSDLDIEIDKLVGPDEITRGSVTGTLEFFNMHAGVNRFRIYPVVGPSKVECQFAKELLPKAAAAVTKYVSVEGELRYKSSEPFAYAINVSDIEVFPDEEQLPTILDLRGIAPSATGDTSSEDFVRSLRAHW